MSTIHFIGGEKGGVGKSVVARLVAQYCIDRAIPFIALDADGSHGSLLRHYAEHTRAVSFDRFESADEIMALATETGSSPGSRRRASWSWRRSVMSSSCYGT
jgi:CO dehydrogenase nickel-insertion accessory protein CooC1